MGQQWTDADQPPGVLPSRCVPVWEPSEPDPCDGEAVAADEGCHPDLRAGRGDLRSFCGSRTTILAAAEEGYRAVGLEVTDSYYKLGTDRVRFALDAAKATEK